MAQLKTTNVHGDLHVSGDITQEGNKVYHEGYKPTKGDVGLGSVDNYSRAHYDERYATAAQGTKADNAQPKETGKGLSTNDYTSAEKTKLSGIATGATKNATDVQLRDRATHTGTQAISTVSGLQTSLDAKANTTTQVIAGTGLSGGGNLSANRTLNVSYGTTAGTAAQGNDSRITGALQKSSNLEDVADADTARNNLGLGNVDNTSDVNKPISSSTQSALDLKVNKETGKSLISSADLQKLSGIEAGAQVNLISVDNLTSDSATRPLSAKQGKVLKSLIDSINGLLQSDDSTLDELQEIVDFIKLNREELDSLGITSIAGLEDALDGKQPLSSILTGTTASFTSALKTKLDAIAAGATKNATDAQLRNRTTHTGTQAISTIDGLQTSLDGKVDTSDTRLTNSRDWSATVVTQAEAQAGTSTTARKWTAQRVSQAISALGLKIGTTASTAKAGNWTPTWSEVSSKPTTFTPESHTHSLSEITDAGSVASLSTTGSTTAFLRGDGTWATPPNTNTTYTEITTAEIDAGTASTLRTISGRRMKYALDKKADTTTQVIAGNGLSGGGTLADNSTVALGTPSTLTGATTNAVTSTSHTHAINVTKSDVGLGNVTNVAQAAASTQIIAGTGLSGGGTLAADRTLSVSYGTTAGTATQGNDSRITGAMQKSANLGDVADAAIARSNLGIDDAAIRWPTWSEVTSKPSTFAPSAHNHSWSNITSGVPATATRWPTWNEVTGKPNVGSMPLPSNNLNNAMAPGFYHWTTGESNSPTGYGSMLTLAWDGTGAATADQLVIKNGSMWIRGKNNQSSSWSAWRTVYHTGNLPATATRWPSWGEVSGKPGTFTPHTGNGGVGTYAIVTRGGVGSAVSWGNTIAGSTLRTSSFHAYTSGASQGTATIPIGSALSGTWRIMGNSLTRASTTATAVLAVRIS